MVLRLETHIKEALPWNVHACVCMCVCACMYICVCMHVHMCMMCLCSFPHIIPTALNPDELTVSVASPTAYFYHVESIFGYHYINKNMQDDFPEGWCTFHQHGDMTLDKGYNFPLGSPPQTGHLGHSHIFNLPSHSWVCCVIRGGSRTLTGGGALFINFFPGTRPLLTKPHPLFYCSMSKRGGSLETGPGEGSRRDN